MKNLLTILVAIGLTATSTTSLISCEKSNNKNIPCEKQDNRNWKQQCSQNKPFNQVDNKYYFVVWHGLFKNEWKISMFNNNAEQIKISTISTWLMKNFGDLQVGYGRSWKDWKNNDDIYFKSVYRWDGVDEPQTPEIDKNTGKITDWKE
ncbi:lipoprotein [Spiroplasma endosymbiont of Ammophila pubescens]|uniref:lipoprotein n=1 Tax=Spiroplasma endosymbiont of Ammophila pubescens TaxID=3066315 RepID=UPI0032B27C71